MIMSAYSYHSSQSGSRHIPNTVADRLILVSQRFNHSGEVGDQGPNGPFCNVACYTGAAYLKHGDSVALQTQHLVYHQY
jgi:hypothetical protein